MEYPEQPTLKVSGSKNSVLTLQNRIANIAKIFSVIFPVLVYISIPVIFYFLWFLMYTTLPSFQEAVVRFKPVLAYHEISNKKNPGPSELLFLQKNRVKKLEKIYEKYTNRLPYIIINTSDNNFSLYSNGKLVREGLCSTGSYVLLDAGDQKWKFDTPKGVRRIQGKTESPVWRKPDWAFIEEGLPIPKYENSAERYEYGAMGDYALSIGNGFLIHGTLYQRLLGMPVTHGCIRMGDADLEKVFNTLQIGSKVYIF